MNATTNQADPWKRPNRDDQWARVDYRSRAAAAICVYADLDVMARRSWEPIRALCPELVLARADQFGPFLSPDTMLASAGAPFLKHVLETMPAKANSITRRLLGPFLSVLTTTGPVHLTESFLEYRSAHAVAAGNVIIIGDGYYTGRVTPRKLVGHLRGRSWHERDAFAGRPKNMVVVPVVSSFVWIAAACCCALRRRRQQRRLSGKGV